MAPQTTPRSRQQPEPVVEAVPHVLGAHGHHPGRRQLDSQGHPVQPPADVDDRGGVVGVGQPEAGGHRPGPGHEQLHRRRAHPGRHLQGRHRPHLLAGDPQALPGGGQHLHRRGASQDLLHHLGGRLQHLLAIVHHHQHVPPRQRHGHTVGHAPPRPGGHPQGGGHRLGHRLGVTHRGQLHQPHPLPEGAGQLGRHLEGQAGLAHPRPPRSRSPAGAPPPPPPVRPPRLGGPQNW